ncbi:unnamed protein product [Ranitomeya imitator]|uniref:MHD domain-containing protein n=1 Tax=Ranitomeya imitator TaxID=111125 RepID=A0ABN9L315_9NEOB|nr:unnamed protein product [Ranitomeya imitator]
MESPEGTISQQQQQEPQQQSDKPRRSSQRRSSGSSRAGGAKEARISIPKSSSRKDLPATKDPPSTVPLITGREQLALESEVRELQQKNVLVKVPAGEEGVTNSLWTVPRTVLLNFDNGHLGSRLRIYVKLRCDLSPKSQAINVCVQIPVPKGTSSVSQDLGSPDQSAALTLNTQSLSWKIPRIRGGSQLSALFKVDVSGCTSLPSVLDLPPLNLSFEVPSLTCSGLQIRFLRLRSERPAPIHTWVRYLTQSDSYSVRLG